MANTYTQILLQFVFAVKGRENVILKTWKEELYKFITGIIVNNNCKLLAINGFQDHIHILLGLGTNISVSDLAREIKANSSRFINEKHFVAGKFEWQLGYGAFSYGRSQIDAVVQYINKQEEHHRKKTFREEYIEFLKLFQIDYNPEYIFDEMNYE